MRLICALLFVLTAGAAFGAGWTGDQKEVLVPSTLEARLSDQAQLLLFKTPVEKLKAQKVDLVQATGKVKLTIEEVKKGEGENQIWEYRFEPGEEYGPGTWMVFRDGLGRYREVRVILLGAPKPGDHRIVHTGTWVRLSTLKTTNRTRLDLFLAGVQVGGGWEIPMPLSDIPNQGEDLLWQSTKSEIDWGSLVPLRRWEDERVEAFQAQMRKRLSGAVENPSGLWLPDPRGGLDGTDPSGRPWGVWSSVDSSSGNAPGLGPWGVSLWAADAILRGWKVDFPRLEDLLESRSRLPGYSPSLTRDNLADDPAFSLDWIRNLGLQLSQKLYPERPLRNENADVGSLPLLSEVSNTGFEAAEFNPLVHLLAATKPGRVYLASLTSQVLDKRSSSAVFFREPVVLIPWVGEDEDVRVSIFVGTKEISWDAWLSQSQKQRGGVRPDHILLVEMPLPENVYFPVLPVN